MELTLNEIMVERRAEVLAEQRVKEILPERLEQRVKEILPERLEQRVKEILPERLEQRVKEILEGLKEEFKRDAEKQDREMLRLALEARFGPLSPGTQQRAEAIPANRLRDVLLQVVKGQSLQEMGLDP